MNFQFGAFEKELILLIKKKLFDRYFQVPTDGQNKSGPGLGLAISKDFIEAQNGRVGLGSEIGEGSRFYFVLPTIE